MLVLFKLLVSHSDHLGVQSHLVHMLHIVMLLIELLLSLREQTFSPLVLLNFNLSWRQL